MVPRRPAGGGYGDRGGFGGGRGGFDRGGFGGDRGGFDRGGFDDAPVEMVEGRVKFFNPDKGFGFILPDDGSRDVFVSASTLERNGIGTLENNQRVRVGIRMGHKGPMAQTIELA
jgi:CspA family cold shock protein